MPRNLRCLYPGRPFNQRLLGKSACSNFCTKANHISLHSIRQVEEAYQILICRLCIAVVRPGRNIEPYFRREYQLKGQILHDIRDYYSNVQLSDPKTAELPADGTIQVRLQTWLYGSYVRYWIVKHGAERQDEEYVTSDSTAEKMIAESGDVEEDLDRDSAWVKRLGWVRHFGNRDKLEVYKAAE
ncbi:hypothetical protein BR93DRAFT_942833 [Coniochaeta sp. PMI_546]|nr:hypothetical protein BR93DRAFT_942833 [Coniochaeta sp. PMI_546]